MATKISLKKYEAPDPEDLVSSEMKVTSKDLVLHLNAALAIKLKQQGFDVYASLDDDKSRLWISSIIADQQAVIHLAQVVWPNESELLEYLDTDGIDQIREGVLKELLNFSNPHFQNALKTVIVESQDMTRKIAEHSEKEFQKAMGAMKSKILSNLPTGQKMDEIVEQQYAKFQAQMLGEERTEPSGASAGSP